MAMLASKSPYPAPGAGSVYNKDVYRSNVGNFASPTESEFSETYEASDSVRCDYILLDITYM